ncbi:MAG: YigZ family protein [Mycobacterium sp.]
MPFSLKPGTPAYAEATIKNSRFIARLGYVDDEDAAAAFIRGVRDAERGAGHHCFAYVVGDDEESRIERFSDDGEPTGTAGAPILNAIKANGLVNTAAVVSRHYGGVKLGTGGLARAYSGTVSAAIADADLRTRRRWLVFRLTADHTEAGRLEAELRGRGVEVSDVDYGEQAVLTLVCAEGPRLTAIVGELTSGRGNLIPAGRIWR